MDTESELYPFPTRERRTPQARSASEDYWAISQASRDEIEAWKRGERLATSCGSQARTYLHLHHGIET